MLRRVVPLVSPQFPYILSCSCPLCFLTVLCSQLTFCSSTCVPLPIVCFPFHVKLVCWMSSALIKIIVSRLQLKFISLQESRTEYNSRFWLVWIWTVECCGICLRFQVQIECEGLEILTAWVRTFLFNTLTLTY